jgi:predicted phage terminase large subunit-like protein
MTTPRGSRLSTSMGGTLTGRGGQFIVIDDPLKPADALSDARRESTNEWFSHTLLSRLDDKRTGAIVIVMQRLHQHDLVGHVQELSPGWTVLSLPAIAEAEHRVQIGPDRWKVRRVGELLHPEREPLAALEEIKANLGSDIFSAQYQQSPVPPGGAMIRRDWVRRYDAPPVRGQGYQVVQSWDTAVQVGESNDWSVGTTWLYKEGEYYLLDVIRKRLEYPDLKREVEAAAARFEPSTVLVENTALGSALVQERRASRNPFIPITPEKDKVSRMAVQAAKFEAGQVFLPARASWLPDLETELFAFPQSRHDDQVDSVSQFLEWASQPRAVPRVRLL